MMAPLCMVTPLCLVEPLCTLQRVSPFITHLVSTSAATFTQTPPKATSQSSSGMREIISTALRSTCTAIAEYDFRYNHRVKLAPEIWPALKLRSVEPMAGGLLPKSNSSSLLDKRLALSLVEAKAVEAAKTFRARRFHEIDLTGCGCVANAAPSAASNLD